ncbi:MAG: transporter permease protein [Symbiobacteriaceae bacterium]|jgi:ABC-type dipeptide/oligopeptide/nickel transport system permease component|nr:transporter permease protein [Symbiobacteriaceae bacterium]
MQWWRRLGALVGREVIGLLLVAGLVIALAALPPVRAGRQPDNMLDVKLSLDTGAWGQSIVGYVDMLASGTLGRDRNGLAVAPLLGARLGHSLMLLGIALGIALLLGVPKGIWDFRQMRRRRLALGTLLSGAVQGLPDFLLVFLLQYAGVLLFRAMGWRPFPVAWDETEPLRSLIFPLICLTVVPWAYISRLTSTALGHVWEEDYIRTAHAKGLREWVVVYRHAMRNAVILLLEGLPNILLVMISNLLIVEYLFGLPGLTILLKDAVQPDPRRMVAGGQPAADLPLLAGAALTLALVFTVLYTTVTVLRRIADPRIKERDAA